MQLETSSRDCNDNGGDGLESLLSVAFHFAPVGLLVAKSRMISFYNRSFSDMFGYGPDELNGQSLDCLYPSIEEFRHIGDRATTEMRKTGFYSDERIMRHKSGRLFWCHTSGRTLDKAVPLHAATWVFEDISVRRPVSADLTVREREIAQLLVLGKSSKMIGKELSISPRTVEAHRTRLMRKLQAETASDLVARLVGRDRNND
ncbi:MULTISPECIES: PAS and helix-turn-helix domain-containing protein [Paraburkholderia]|uniref:PAS and helix-turn-helix domain-containing protein n=1 Tax=Paraburkholderia TaxID=1822464 RepID=UPI0032184944